MNRPKPDDRSDNVEKLQEMVANTIGNYRDAKMMIESNQLNEKEKQDLIDKNERRKESIDSFRSEIQDESNQ